MYVPLTKKKQLFIDCCYIATPNMVEQLALQGNPVMIAGLSCKYYRFLFNRGNPQVQVPALQTNQPRRELSVFKYNFIYFMNFPTTAILGPNVLAMQHPRSKDGLTDCHSKVRRKSMH